MTDNREELQNLYKLIYQFLNLGMMPSAERLRGKLAEVMKGVTYATQNSKD